VWYVRFRHSGAQGTFTRALRSSSSALLLRTRSSAPAHVTRYSTRAGTARPRPHPRRRRSAAAAQPRAAMDGGGAAAGEYQPLAAQQPQAYGAAGVRIARPGEIPHGGAAKLSRDGSVHVTDEVFNTASHFIAFMLSLLGGAELIVKASEQARAAAVCAHAARMCVTCAGALGCWPRAAARARRAPATRPYTSYSPARAHARAPPRAAHATLASALATATNSPLRALLRTGAALEDRRLLYLQLNPLSAVRVLHAAPRTRRPRAHGARFENR
jgi:hypothetical protein